MSRDFKRGGSAADGAAPKRVYRGTGFRPAGAENGTGFRRMAGNEGFRSRARDDRFREREQEREFRRDDRRDNRRDNRSDGGRTAVRKGYSGRPSFEYPEKREFRGEKRGFGLDFRKRGSTPEYSRKEERRFIKNIERFERLPQSRQQEQRPKNDNGEVRLNKFISNSGICSRREADTYIQAGLVTVDGVVITQLGTKVRPDADIRFNGEKLSGQKKIYIVMNKPKGYVTTTSDPHADKTVMDLLYNCKQRVFPVGRLDKYTTGVLLFTNDGELAEKLSHPSYNKKKVYQVTLDRNLQQSDFNKILDGIWLPDGEIHADELSYIDNDKSVVGLEIHSGRNRIVRRIFESLGYKIKKLDRCYFAGLTKKGLKPGNWRYLTENEINFLRMGSYQ